ncbi:MAG: DinB family protein [Ferruginibacter sp.]|nr:DinB family protein [Ferruginibacter sp.]
MKKILTHYASYNLWANQRITDAILNLPDDHIYREIASSFSSIYKTAIHLWNTESIWWQRIKLSESVKAPSEGFNGTVMDVCINWLKLSAQWEKWIEKATEATLLDEFSYRNISHIPFRQPVYEVLHHLFNHQTYHRGQLVTLFRQLDIKQIPATDLILFYRKK